MKPSDFGIKNFPEFRSHQFETAMQAYCALFVQGKKHGLIQSSVGTGKTLLAMTVTKLSDEPIPVIYLATNHDLQHQCQKDFPESELLMGRGNYTCAKHPELSAEYCDRKTLICERCSLAQMGCKPDTKQRCDCRIYCEYEKQKFKTLLAPVGVLNPAYYLQECNTAGLFSGRQLIIVDEADTLESQLMEFIQLNIPATVIARYGLQPSPKFKTRPTAWREWALSALEIVNMRLSKLNLLWGVEDIREQTQLERLQRKLQFFAEEVCDEWIWDEATNTYRPITVSSYAERFFWRHAKHFLCMSATLSPMHQFMQDLGIDEANTVCFDLPSPFPDRNLIHVRPVANMNFKTQATEFPKFLAEFDAILDKHPSEKGLCHCVSYEILKGIRERSRHGNRLIAHDKYNRQTILKQFMNSTEPLVLLSPSCERGLDLKDDLCRFIILAKVPFGYLKDKQISARLYSGREGRRWYLSQVVRRVMQGLGRGMRSPTDYCSNYILDAAFIKFYRENRMMFPMWFRDTIRIEEGVVTISH